ncbi:MAG: hypothetical protein IPH12_01670 [Saprospirales bacterium]|nr:hypothetical protein [Saprospirales bacterium]MBK8921637.1 hypothetical protein [Saprospirales bacterium]
MKTIVPGILGLLFFLAQIYLTFNGLDYFSKYANPLALFLVSMAIALLYFYQQLQAPAGGASRLLPLRAAPALLWALAGALTMVSGYEELRKLLVMYPNPGQYSDVLPQLEAQYHRFSRGEMPYAPVDLGYNAPYPVYMPLHWLPVGLSAGLGIDSRWAGYGLLVLAAGVYGYWIGRQNAPLAGRAAALFLPALGLWGFILWGRLELPVSFETVVAAYYLVLVAGLLGRHTGWITVGLIACLLSRYTLIFWLPLLGYVLWTEQPRRVSARLWRNVALGILLLYVLPFLLRDPGIFATGIKYHNDGAVAQWIGQGDPPVSWSMEKGVYFGINMKRWLPGDGAQQVLLARAVQAAVMLLLLGFGFWACRRWKDQLDGYSLCLVMLYAMVGCFYFFSPMTFQYYYLVLFMLSAAAVAKMLITASGGVQSAGPAA